jgi:hypothetical protein
MLDGKQNDGLSWKDKLDDPNSVQTGEKFDKNAAWEKLHGRLTEKKAKKLPVWYWVAAASFFLMLLLSIMLIKRTTNPIVRNEPKSPTKSSGKTIPLPAVASTGGNENPAKGIIEKKIPNKERENHNKKIVAKDPVGKENITVNALSQTETVQPGAVVSTVPRKDSILVASAVPQKLKKMRVVHINELGALPAADLSSADHQQNPFDRFFGNGNFINSRPAEGPTDYAGILKIKISPKN